MLPSGYQEPTYTTAILVVKMIRALEDAPNGEIKIETLAELLEVHPRTIKRYVEAIGSVVFGNGDKPYVERVRKGRTPYARLNRPESQTMQINLLNYAALRLASASLSSVDPEGFGLLHENVRDIAKRGLSSSHLEELKNFDEAFLYVPHGQKRYGEKESKTVRRVLQAIAKKNPLSIIYNPENKKRRVKRVVHPLAVVLYKDALYVYAWQKLPQEEEQPYRYFAIDRIDTIEVDFEKTFKFPKGYKPDQVGKDSLGIWETGKRELVHLVFKDAAARHVKERTWPNMVSCEELEDGQVELKMHIPITPEVVSWLAGWGGQVEVLEPEDLIEELRNHLADALDHYI